MIAKQREIASRHRYRVAIPEWVIDDGIANMIASELELMGHEPVLFYFGGRIPEDIDYLLTFGPYDTILPLWEKNALVQSRHRPIAIHWNTEGMPDPRIPSRVVGALGALRSKIGRMGNSASALDRFFYSLSPISKIDQSYKRYRYHGDYAYAIRKGWLHILSDTSFIYSQLRNAVGIPTLYAPWGASERWYEDLGLERDIDVLWMGKRGSSRRGRILDQVFSTLKSKGLNVYIGDNEIDPFIFGDQRTRFLNRAKITLNITRTWYDDNFSRFSMACSNRSMIVSESLLPHCPEFKENVHYISAKIGDLADTIVHYVEHEDERKQIVDNAYNLMTSELRFENSLRRMFAAAQQYARRGITDAQT